MAETALAMAGDDQLIQGGAPLSREAAQAEVIQDQQVWRQVAAEDLLKSMVRARLAQLLEEPIRAPRAPSGRPAPWRPQGPGPRRSSRRPRADDQHVFLALEEVEREDVLELATIELNRSRPIELVQGDALLKAGLEQVPLQGLLLAPLDHVGQQHRMRKAA